jgi:hypothetical protein
MTTMTVQPAAAASQTAIGTEFDEFRAQLTHLEDEFVFTTLQT